MRKGLVHLCIYTFECSCNMVVELCSFFYLLTPYLPPQGDNPGQHQFLNDSVQCCDSCSRTHRINVLMFCVCMHVTYIHCVHMVLYDVCVFEYAYTFTYTRMCVSYRDVCVCECLIGWLAGCMSEYKCFDLIFFLHICKIF